MLLSDYIEQFLYSNGVDTVFEMIGGMSVRIIDSIYKSGRIRIISAHHEQGAAFAACGWAKSKGIPGVAISTSGPGATNLITGIATSYFDSIPVVFITGQVNQNELSHSMGIRQLGFQETDIVSIVSPITKYAVQLESASDITKLLPRAFEIANHGRKGPVLLDIPMNLQKEEIQHTKRDKTPSICDMNLSPQVIQTYEGTINRLNIEIAKSQRPLFLIGGGVVQSNTKEIMRAIISKSTIPAVFSLHGKEVLETDSNLSVGLIGTYGNRWANIALYESDLLIVVGSRLDIRQTGADTKSFKDGKRIIQIDIDKNEIGVRIATEMSCCANLNDILPLLYDRIQTYDNASKWVHYIKTLKNKFKDDKELSGINGINPNYFLKQLGLIKAHDIQGYVTDVGANQIWAAQSIPISGKQFFYTSGGMGAMGYALPVAIGATLANIDEDKAVVAIAGDGGIQCNIQELELLYRLKLPIKLIILNNISLGMVKQFQDELCSSRYPGTVVTYGAPNFLKIAEAYNIPALTISQESDIGNGLNWLFATMGPSILEVSIDIDTGIYPKMQFRHKLNDMFPYI
ncbi:thiamine pyrophosphate-binding protein [Cloacibacillus sp.]